MDAYPFDHEALLPINVKDVYVTYVEDGVEKEGYLQESIIMPATRIAFLTCNCSTPHICCKWEKDINDGLPPFTCSAHVPEGTYFKRIPKAPPLPTPVL